MKCFEIKLQGKEEIIDLTKLPKQKLDEMLGWLLEYENYELCSVIKNVYEGNNENP